MVITLFLKEWMILLKKQSVILLKKKLKFVIINIRIFFKKKIGGRKSTCSSVHVLQALHVDCYYQSVKMRMNAAVAQSWVLISPKDQAPESNINNNIKLMYHINTHKYMGSLTL